MKKINIKSLNLPQLEAFVADLGMARFRAIQIFQWLYQKRASFFEEMTNLNKADQRLLSTIAYISRLEIVRQQKSQDCTEKLLFRLEDGQLIESVLIPDRDRLTLCVSSQVGCPLACQFCLSGEFGYSRNLQAYEIVDQVLFTQSYLQPSNRRLTNIVMMGIGEPLLNIDNIVEAIHLITHSSGVGLSGKHITVSTAGIVPGINELGKRAGNVNLSVSLNATSDEQRSFIMPINKKYPISMLLESCWQFPLPPRRRITFEYVLLKGINDTITDARHLVRLLSGLRCKVNLIPFNLYPGCRFEKPDQRSVIAFQKVLTDHFMSVFIRKSRGKDIMAACGQLRGLEEGLGSTVESISESKLISREI